MPDSSPPAFVDRLLTLWADPDPASDPVLHRAIDDLIALGRDDVLTAAAARIRDQRGEAEADVFARSVQAIAETTTCPVDGQPQTAALFALAVVGPDPTVTTPRHLMMTLGCSPLLPEGAGLMILAEWYGLREIEALSPAERRRLLRGLMRGRRPDIPPHDASDGVSVILAAAFVPAEDDSDDGATIEESLLAPDVGDRPAFCAWRRSVLGGVDGGGWRGAILDILAPCPLHLLPHALARTAAAQTPQPARATPRPTLRVIQGGRA